MLRSAAIVAVAAVLWPSAGGAAQDHRTLEEKARGTGPGTGKQIYEVGRFGYKHGFEALKLLANSFGATRLFGVDPSDQKVDSLGQKMGGVIVNEAALDVAGLITIADARPSVPTLAWDTRHVWAFLARNVGIHSIADGVEALRDGQARAFDLVQVDCHIDGRPSRTHAFLYGSAGFTSIRGVRPWMKRVLGPTGAYYLATFLQIIAYRPPVMTVRTEEQERTGHTWMVIAGNAEWTAGGSMRVSPGAKIDDGELNISIIPSIPKLNMITTMFPKVATGEHVHHPGVAYFPARSVEVHSDPPVDVELDGDLIGMTPATFTVHPHSVHVMTPASSSTAADA